MTEQERKEYLNKKSKEYYQQNKEKQLAYQKEYQKIPRVRARLRVKQREYYAKNRAAMTQEDKDNFNALQRAKPKVKWADKPEEYKFKQKMRLYAKITAAKTGVTLVQALIDVAPTEYRLYMTAAERRAINEHK